MASNIGMYVDGDHNLWLDEATPSVHDATTGNGLQAGKVVKSTGICGSDIHFWKHGSIGPWKVTKPHILGHESAGVVIAVHSTVNKLAVGDRVAIEPHITCGNCEPCLIGRYNGCKNLIFRWSPPSHGLLRRYVNHPATWYHKLAVSHSTKIGDPVLICGAGPIGLITLHVCQAAGAYPIVIKDIDDTRLQFAKSIMSCVIRPGQTWAPAHERVL
ncbi:hypothetical protein PENSTE_c004G00808 [Penicillium steckii]|uniref:Alcohol dehydrogenase-like N-terminal domain-containing protein n=1 Tax=Penicillium steckii TaxID=303698 RepID=A0A1V6TPM2_9EURO|nr:hypothetical protein PENSTE_c004G00808 [Penicillium steckii]